MAERLPEIEDSDVSLKNLESELKIVKQRVEHVKQQVKGAFQEFTVKLIQRENELLAELDDIPTCIEVKIDECRDSLTQLKQHRAETEKDLQTNKLNQFLKNQLENIKLEIKRISTEDISFPHISLRLYMTPFATGLKDACSIEKRTKIYTNKMPVWSGVKSGKGETELDAPYSICIDPVTQLIYISEFSDTQRIQVFAENGNYHSTLYNEEITHSRTIRLNKDYIYISSGLKMLKNAKILKLNKRGELIKSISIEQGIFGMAFLADRIYTTSSGSTTVQIYDVNLKHKNTISLQAKSFDDEIIACDIIVREDSIYVLFRGRLKCHSEFIQLFQLDGAFIRTISSEMVKQASNFCLDKYSNFIVSDWTSHCINVYSEDGVLIHTIGEVMSNEAPLCLPRGVAVNASGRIVVVNAKADNMLQIY